MPLKFIAIIPSRHASQRFPGKPLALVGGKPMVVRVAEQASQAVGEVVVATDHDGIRGAVEAHGHRAVMTAADLRSGTDRCLAAYEAVGSDADVVINVQGDEPFITPGQIRQLMGCFDDPTVDIATLLLPYPQDAGIEGLEDPNLVKAVRGEDGNALYFSRSVIPYVRGHEKAEWPRLHRYYTHVGMYAYRIGALRRAVSLPTGTLERAESLEQLRWLEAGMTIRTAITTHRSIGIDTPADLEAANRYFQEHCHECKGR